MPIKFIKTYGVYNAGDVVAFEADMASKLVAAGVATEWHADINDRKPVTRKMVTK